MSVSTARKRLWDVCSASVRKAAASDMPVRTMTCRFWIKKIFSVSGMPRWRESQFSFGTLFFSTDDVLCGVCGISVKCKNQNPKMKINKPKISRQMSRRDFFFLHFAFSILLFRHPQYLVNGRHAMFRFYECVLQHGMHAFFRGFFLDFIGGRALDHQLRDGSGHGQHFIDAHAAFVAVLIALFAPSPAPKFDCFKFGFR